MYLPVLLGDRSIYMIVKCEPSNVCRTSETLGGALDTVRLMRNAWPVLDPPECVQTSHHHVEDLQAACCDGSPGPSAMPGRRSASGFKPRKIPERGQPIATPSGT